MLTRIKTLLGILILNYWRDRAAIALIVTRKTAYRLPKGDNHGWHENQRLPVAFFLAETAATTYYLNFK
jgi:hypothetical protein